MSASKWKKSANLSGAWSGVYSYDGGSAPVSFSATLTQSGEWITGTTEEIGHFGDAADRRMTATLQGRREGARVGWLKLYDRLWMTYDEVSYTGEVNDDGSEISGRWTTGPEWSGAFLMIRTPRAALAATRETGASFRRVGRGHRTAQSVRR